MCFQFAPTFPLRLMDVFHFPGPVGEVLYLSSTSWYLRKGIIKMVTDVNRNIYCRLWNFNYYIIIRDFSRRSLHNEILLFGARLSIPTPLFGHNYCELIDGIVIFGGIGKVAGLCVCLCVCMCPSMRAHLCARSLRAKQLILYFDFEFSNCILRADLLGSS